MKSINWFILGMGMMASCTLSETSPEASDYRYFPLEPGHYVEYEVQETSYAVGKTPTSSVYFLKEVCSVGVPGAEGRTEYQMKRYRRQNAQQSWAVDSVWSAYLLPDRAVKVENNRPFLKMIFPLYEGLTWNGNQYNTLAPQEYKIRFSNAPVTLHTLTFPKSVDVVQRFDSSLVTLVKYTERYAYDVGLIYKESTALDYCQSDACLGKNIIESGTKKVMSIVAYGKE